MQCIKLHTLIFAGKCTLACNAVFFCCVLRSGESRRRRPPRRVSFCVEKQRWCWPSSSLRARRARGGSSLRQSAKREQRLATQCQTSLRRGNCYAGSVPPITNIEATVAQHSTPSPPLVGVRSSEDFWSVAVKCKVQCETRNGPGRNLWFWFFAVELWVCSVDALRSLPPRKFYLCLRSRCRQSAHSCGLLWELLEVSVSEFFSTRSFFPFFDSGRRQDKFARKVVVQKSLIVGLTKYSRVECLSYR